MEISAVFSNRVNPIILTAGGGFPSPTTTPPPRFSLPLTRPIKNSLSASASASTSATPTPTPAHSTPKYVTKKFTPTPWTDEEKARHAAILDIKKSPVLLSALNRSGAILKVDDLNYLMRYFAKLNRLHLLNQLFTWMKQNEKIDFASYSSYMKLMGRSLNPLRALDIYNSIEDQSTRIHTSVCNAVLSCLTKSGKFDISIDLFCKMKQEGLIPDVVTYSTLLAGCAKVKDGYSKALDLVQELKSRGLQMDSVLYGTILYVCASTNRCKEAEDYFIEMKNEGHSPNLFHYSSLLNAYAIGGEYNKADEILVDMKAAGIVPNTVLLTTLLKVYVRGGLFEKSKELLRELEALGHAKVEMPYCLLMDGLAKAGQINEAKLVFDEMKGKNVKIDGYSYSIMISAFCRCGRLEEAKQLASDFEAKYQKYDVVILNTMLCAYCIAGEMENVMKMMKKLDELAIKPDRSTFTILIKYFRKEKLYLLAYQTLQDMHRKGYLPDQETCSLLIYYLGKTGAHSEAFSVYNILRYSKRAMSNSLHGKILEVLIAGGLYKDAYVVVKDNAGLISRAAIRKFATAFMRSGNINLINDVIKALHSSGYKVDEGLFFTAISRYLDQPEKKELLLQLLEWMPGQGYAVDSSTRNLMLQNSELLGRQRTAEILSKQRMVSNAIKAREMKEN